MMTRQGRGALDNERGRQTKENSLEKEGATGQKKKRWARKKTKPIQRKQLPLGQFFFFQSPSHCKRDSASACLQGKQSEPYSVMETKKKKSCQGGKPQIEKISKMQNFEKIPQSENSAICLCFNRLPWKSRVSSPYSSALNPKPIFHYFSKNVHQFSFFQTFFRCFSFFTRISQNPPKS